MKQNLFNKLWLRVGMIVAIMTTALSGTAWAEKITDYTNIVSGTQYYIGATTGNTDYYLSVNGSSLSTSIAGTAVTSQASATPFTFAGSGTSWTIQFESGYYLSLKSSKDNGKVQVVEDAATFTASNLSGKIRLTIGSYSIQKNNSGTQFGSYGNTQTDLWLEPVPTGPITYTVTYNANGATSGTVPTDNTVYSSGATVTVLGNTGNLAKTGYTFNGWNTAANGNGTDYAAGATFNISANTTLYAQWEEQLPANTTKLTFDVSSNPGSWPTENSTTLTNYTYTLNSVDYTFALKNVKCNSGYLMMTSVAVLGLPAIEGYKLTKVVASNSGGCSTSTKVGISSSAGSADYISGGEIQTWSTTSSSYTYTLTSTEENTMYYLYVTNKNAQVTSLDLYYEAAAPNPAVATTTTIDATGITNTDVYTSTAAGTLTASVTAGGSAVSGAIVTWSSSNTGVATIDANGTVTLVAVGTTTITASYAGVENEYKPSSSTYELTVTSSEPVPGTEADPYTVAEARAAIDAGTGLTNVYATGIISQVDSYNSTYKSITYWISDDGTTTNQLQVYSGKGLNSADFSSINDVVVGATVVVRGTLKKYNSTYEFDKNNYLTSYVAPTIEAPVFSVAGGTYYAAQSVELTCGTEGATIKFSTDGGTTWNTYSSAISISSTTTLSAKAVNGTAESPVVSETYTIKAADAAGGPENPYTVAQARTAIDAGTDITNVYATGVVSAIPNVWSSEHNNITFNFIDEGGSDFLQAYRCVSTATADASTVVVGDIVVVKGNLKKYNETYEFESGCELVSLTHSVTPTATTVTLGTHTNVTSVAMWLNDNDLTDINSGDEVAAGTEVFVLPTAAEGYEVESVTVVDANNNSVTVAENSGNWSFVMPNSSVTVNITAVQSSVTPPTPITGDKYVKVTSTDNLTDGQYLIVCEDQDVAFNGGLETLDAASNTISVTISNNEIAADATTNAAAFTIDVTAGTILSASGFYIGQTSDANGMKTSVETEYENTISISDGDADIVSSGGAYMRYNASSGQERFRYFKSSTYTAQKAIQLYKFVEATTPADDVEVTIAIGYSTLYYGDRNLVVPADVEAYTYKVTNKLEVSKTYEAGDVIPAGTAVVLKAANGSYTFEATTETGEGDEDNALKGSDEAATTTGGTYYYALSLNSSSDLSSVGFYWMTTDGAAFTCGAHKAYLALDNTFAELASGGVKGFIALPDDDATAISTAESFTEEGAIYNVAGQRLQKMQKGINIVNGKKVLK